MASPIVTAEWDSPLGALFVGATEEGICCLEFDGDTSADGRRAALSKTFARPVVSGHNAHFDSLRNELDDYFAGRRGGRGAHRVRRIGDAHGRGEGGYPPQAPSTRFSYLSFAAWLFASLTAS